MNRLYILALLLVFVLCGAKTDLQAEEPQTAKILIGCPVRQTPEILRLFLTSLERLHPAGCLFDYLFVDDNEERESSLLLHAFAEKQGGRCQIEAASAGFGKEHYLCNETTHHWKEELIWKVAAFKDGMIERASKEGYDYLFLIDSDILLHPETILQLIRADKEIVSNIFWTRWLPNAPELPQVWLSDKYTQYEKRIGETLSASEIEQRRAAFLSRLRQAGTYEVGGLGACTLIHKSALRKGVAFKRIHNLSLWGEDRHFCVRAAAMGIPLFVDTHFPAYHIYRLSDLAGACHFLRGAVHPRITLSMIIKNEERRYLRRVLESAKEYITDAVVIDDGSTDGSVRICEEVLQGIPLHLVKNEASKFANEVLLRKQQWEETLKTRPEWILVLDADEILEERAQKEIGALVAASGVDAYYFRLYDFWDETSYRDDAYWSAHHRYSPFLIRYRPDFAYTWRDTPQHCGRLPQMPAQAIRKRSDLRVKHYGWAKSEDRAAKYQRYRLLDPEAEYGWREQYESILDPEPHLVKWRE